MKPTSSFTNFDFIIADFKTLLPKLYTPYFENFKEPGHTCRRADNVKQFSVTVNTKLRTQYTFID